VGGRASHGYTVEVPSPPHRAGFDMLARNTTAVLLGVLLQLGCSIDELATEEETPSPQDNREVETSRSASSLAHAEVNGEPIGDTTTTDCTSAVEQDFEALKHALAQRDSTAASALVTHSTLHHYENCRILSVDSSTTDFADLDQLSVLLVLQLRFLLSKGELEQMDGKELFEWGVSNGLVKKDTFKSIQIHKVQCEGPTAMATVTKDGQIASDAKFTFRHENDRWKFDMTEVSRMASQQLDAVREQAGKTKIEMAIYLLENTHKEKIPPAILDGPLR